MNSMGQITTNVPNLNLNIAVDGVCLLNGITKVILAGNKLTAHVKDGLSKDQYNELAKELRIIYSFCFENVYSESFDLRGVAHAMSLYGHDKRKNHLLEKSFSNLDQNFSNTSQQLFKDLLTTTANTPLKTRFFNLAYIWTRAHELEDLKLLTEAYVQYWRILDEMHAKGSSDQVISSLQTHGLDESKSNKFAASVLLSISRAERKSAKDEIVEIANLHRLRHPHAHQAGGRQKYYMEEGTHIEAQVYNVFIAYITKLFVIWQLGLDKYYLNPRGNIYELKKQEDE